MIKTISEILSKMYYWDCELCGKSVISTDKEQRGQSCLCMKCVRNELKFESLNYRMTNSTGGKPNE